MKRQPILARTNIRHLYMSLLEIAGVVILAAMLVVLIFSGIKVARENKSNISKLNHLSNQVKQLNNNLSSINSQLKAQKTAAPVK